MRILWPTLLLMTATAQGLAAEERVDPRRGDLRPAEKLQALVERMRQAQSEVETLEASFSQRRESALLLEPLRARGRFSYAAPNRVRWEYLTPDPISMVIADDQMTTWYRDLERAERTDVGGDSQRVLRYMGASTSVDELLRYFTVTLKVPETLSVPYFLRLSPRYERVAKRIQDLQIWIDGQSYLPLRLRFVEGDGDVTEYEFSDLRVNQEMPSDRFVLRLPPGVRVREARLGGRPAGSLR